MGHWQNRAKSPIPVHPSQFHLPSKAFPLCWAGAGPLLLTPEALALPVRCRQDSATEDFSDRHPLQAPLGPGSRWQLA